MVSLASHTSSFNWLLPVSGFVVGLLVGLTGMGGAVLMTPFLMLGIGLPPSLAVGTDLAYASITKLAGAWQHWRQGTVDTARVRDLALGSVPASLLAVRLLGWLRQQNTELAELWLGRMIGLALLLVALLMLQRILGDGDSGRRPASAPCQNRLGIIAIGALGGLLVGLTSVGSGSVILALLVLIAPLSADKLVGTDIAHAALMLSAAALGHFVIGDIHLALVAQLLLGSIPGVLLGSRLTLRVPSRALQVLLAGLLILSSIQMLR